MLATTYANHVKYLKTGSFPLKFESTKSNFKRASKSMTLNAKGTLLRDGKMVVKRSERKKIYQGNLNVKLHQQIWAFHKGHSGRDATWKKIKGRYYWRGGKNFVAHQVSLCIACSQKNSNVWTASMPPLKPIPVLPKVMWRVHGNFCKGMWHFSWVDLMGPLYPTTVDGNKYVAIAVCAFSKYVEAQGRIF